MEPPHAAGTARPVRPGPLSGNRLPRFPPGPDLPSAPKSALPGSQQLPLPAAQAPGPAGSPPLPRGRSFGFFVCPPVPPCGPASGPFPPAPELLPARSPAALPCIPGREQPPASDGLPLRGCLSSSPGQVPPVPQELRGFPPDTRQPEHPSSPGLRQWQYLPGVPPKRKHAPLPRPDAFLFRRSPLPAGWIPGPAGSPPLPQGWSFGFFVCPPVLSGRSAPSPCPPGPHQVPARPPAVLPCIPGRGRSPAPSGLPLTGRQSSVPGPSPPSAQVLPRLRPVPVLRSERPVCLRQRRPKRPNGTLPAMGLPLPSAATLSSIPQLPLPAGRSPGRAGPPPLLRV